MICFFAEVYFIQLLCELVLSQLFSERVSGLFSELDFLEKHE